MVLYIHKFNFCGRTKKTEVSECYHRKHSVKLICSILFVNLCVWVHILNFSSLLKGPFLLTEFVGEGSLPGTSNAAGFLCYGGRGSVVTVLAAKSSQRYRLQCDSLPSLCLLTSQLVERLNRHFARHKDFVCSYSSSLPVHELFSAIGTHFLFREKARKIQVHAPIILHHKYHYIVLSYKCPVFTTFIAVYIYIYIYIFNF
jgi:hypothetical protein